MYNSRQIGSDYENQAAQYLMDKGYNIVCRNFRVSQGEIDIIARKDGYYIFIEVKYRSNTKKGMAEDAVDIKKQRRISRVALVYLKLNGLGTNVPVRFDVVTVTKDGIHHIENAFDYIGGSAW